MVRAMCRVQPKESKSTKDLTLMLDYSKTIHNLDWVDSMHWHTDALRMEDCQVLRREFEL